MSADVGYPDGCVTGECALCNCDHPEHGAACDRFDEMFGGTSWHSENCPQYLAYKAAKAATA